MKQDTTGGGIHYILERPTDTTGNCQIDSYVTVPNQNLGQALSSPPQPMPIDTTGFEIVNILKLPAETTGNGNIDSNL